MLRYFAILCFLLFSFVLKGQSISTPQITCVSVLPNGDVEVTWNVVSDPMGEFVNYELFANGTSITTINSIAINTFTHSPSGANAASVSYILRVNGATGAGNFTLSSAAFSTIYLDVINNSDGYATLNWTAASNATSGKYYIYKAITPNPFSLIDSIDISQTSYLDEIFGICSDTTISYCVSYKYSSSCESFSNVDSNTFRDLLAPSEVNLFDLDVDPTTGFTTLTWIESPDPDVIEYKILKLNPASNLFEQIDVIVGKSNATYTDFNVGTQSAAVAFQSYKIIAVDSCGFNQGLDFFSTVFIDGTPDKCSLSINLEWNPFITGQTSNLQIIPASIVEIATAYEILVDTGTGFTYHATVAKGTNSYLFKNVIPEQLVCYQIRAQLPNGEFSNSSQYCLNLQLEPASQENYVAYATVLDDETVELKLHTERIISNNTIEIFKSENDGLTFESIHEQAVSSNIFTYLDEDVNVNNQSYQYYFVLKDVCNLVRYTSNIATTIHLSGSYDDFDSLPNFNWNAYDRYFSSIENYVLLRSVNGGEFESVKTLNNASLSTQDSLKKVLSQSLKTICYKVKAVEDTLNPYGFKEESYSNVFCIEDIPTIYVPTGFIIDGVSGDFRPRFTYVINRSYEFIIYNRWGQTLFKTNEPLEGWNGYFEEMPVSTGVYVYKIIYKDENNEDQILHGSFTVID
ncbi:MAG: gliding motility-associated C-terminal domain-containing protein [Bacteroidia bacterium]